MDIQHGKPPAFKGFDPEQWELLPGPLTVDLPAYSTEVQEIVKYPPEVIAARLLSHPNISLKRDAPEWWEWEAIWTFQTRVITIGMSLFDLEPPMWGGSALKGTCEPADVVDLLAFMSAELPGIWLHSGLDCSLHSPESLRRVINQQES